MLLGDMFDFAILNEYFIPLNHVRLQNQSFMIHNLLLIDKFCPGEMESELEQDQEAPTVLYLNESTNISTTGIVSHSHFLRSISVIMIKLCCDYFTCKF